MKAYKRDLLVVLKAELDFLDKGGYRSMSWRPNFVFEDSPSCLNFKDPLRAKPCSDCVLMQLVPSGKREERIPCRFIPLDTLGTTVESLYHTATQDELEADVRRWLKATIEALETKQGAEPEQPLEKSRACA